MVRDPRVTMAEAPMDRLQITSIALCVLFNALDGFDVLAISFASPGIARDWGIDRAALGIVLSMELIGMGAGSILLGQLCDRYGRRPTVLLCLSVMAIGMALTALAGDILTLSLWRLFTGLGIGGMLAATNAVVAELSNARRRNLAVAIMAGGYPAGAVLGGSVATMLLVDHSWHWVFGLGAIISAACLPFAWLLLPETISWLIHKQPANALARVNATLARMGHHTIERLPAPDRVASKASLAQLLSGRLAPLTLLLTTAYFAHIMNFYFILKWTPKIVADMGFAASSGGGVLVWANVGGMLGSLALSLLTQYLGVRVLTVGAMLLSMVLVAAFGRVGADLNALALVAAIAGFCTNAAVVGIYAIVAQSFPTAVRAGGTGFVIGVGRGGAALSPVIAGYLFAGGIGLPTVALLMGLGSVVAAAALMLLRYEEGTA